MKRVISNLILIFFIIAVQTQAQRISSGAISKVGTTVGQFLKINVSARTIGMGGAYVAVANDVGSIYTNPAGLANAVGYQTMFTHTDWIADTDYDFGAMALNLGSVGSLGLMVSAFNSGDMAVTTLEKPDGTGELFSFQDFLVGVAYARQLTPNFSIGAVGKYISQQVWHMTASSIAFDVGIIYKSPFWGINLGASIKNFGSKMKLSGRDNKFADNPAGTPNVINAEYELLEYNLPLTFQVGLSKYILESEYNSLIVAVDAITPRDNYEALNIGLEYGWNEIFFARAGYKSLFREDSEEGLTAGVGLYFRLVGTAKIKLDYAYADFGRLETVNRFSLGFNF